MTPVETVYLIPCHYCGNLVDPRHPLTHQHVIGWERKPHVRASGKQGGSDIHAREHLDEYACGTCVARLKAGVSTAQATLL